MPIIKSAIKRMHQATKRRTRNVGTKRSLKVALKAFAAKPNAELLSKAQSELDKAVKKNVVNKNTASRKKAQLAATAKTVGVKIVAAKPAKKVAAKPAEKTAAPAKKSTEKKVPAKKAAASKSTAKKAAK